MYCANQIKKNETCRFECGISTLKLSSFHVHCTFGFQAMGQKPPPDLGPTSGAEALSFVAPAPLAGNARLHLKHCFDLKPRID